jgi:hypothetical protein
MKKLSAQNVVAILSEVPTALRKLASERDSWKARAAKAEGRIAEYERREQVEKVAAMIMEKNLSKGQTMDELRTTLMQKAAEGKLGVVAEAVNMTARSNPLGYLGEDRTTGGGGQAETAFENAILG